MCIDPGRSPEYLVYRVRAYRTTRVNCRDPYRSDMTPPLAVDIDGTLTRPEGPYGLDPRVLDPLRAWPAPVVVATGKTFPYPVALCHLTGIAERVVAENGGVVLADDEIRTIGDGESARAVLSAFEAAAGGLRWELDHTANRWRETEVSFPLDTEETLLRSIATDHGLEVVDTGYAYHVKDAGIDKGTGLRSLADILDLDPGSFVAVGDSVNDVALFESVDRSYAVGNADADARNAADVVLDGAHADGFLEALDRIRGS
jgi:phosphoglycolate phosphatase (TIGR01487 family)